MTTPRGGVHPPRAAASPASPSMDSEPSAGTDGSLPGGAEAITSVRRAAAGDEHRRLRPVEALERDILRVFTRPVVVGEFWVDLDAADWFLRERRADGIRLTFVSLFAKAAALAAMASPRAHRMYGPFGVLEPGSADVGVSIQGDGMLAPVQVLRAAEGKSLSELAVELREKTRQARMEEARMLALVDRYLWLFPFPPLRRLLIRAWFASPRRRRRAVGTIQISVLDRFGIDAAQVPVVAELLLMCGAIRDRVELQPDGRLATRKGAQFRLHGSHRKLNGETGGQFIERFREVLQDPVRWL